MNTIEKKKETLKTRDIPALFSVRGQVVLITGAGGLGTTYARGFAENGAHVILVSRTQEKLLQVQQELREQGLSIDIQVCDIAQQAQVQDVVQYIAKKYGKLDSVIHTAASCILHPVLEDNEAAFRKNCDVNIMGTEFLCQAAGRVMKQQKSGSILLISSLSAYTVNSKDGMSYGVGKAATEMLVRWFALELAEYHVTVNAIAPTAIMTPMMERRNEEYLQKCVARIPMGRISYPDDYLGAAFFLCSEASRFMTGQTIIIDGGSIVSRRFQI